MKESPLSIEGEALIFYNYKEPLRKVVGGHGYMGAILSNKDGSKIQCHICGALFEGLDAHVRQAHEISVREYKEKYGLTYTTALISDKQRMERKMRTIEYFKSLTPEQLADLKRKTKNKIKEFYASKHGDWRNQPKNTLETKNKRGTCPDQLLDKIKKCAEKIGHSPSKREFIDFYNSQKYLHIIYKTFGSWDKAKEMVGLDKLSRSDNHVKGERKTKYSPEELIEYLQIFYKENNKPPTETDCRRGLIPDGIHYRNHFGSMPRAREIAGIYDEVSKGGYHNVNK